MVRVLNFSSNSKNNIIFMRIKIIIILITIVKMGNYLCKINNNKCNSNKIYQF